jgi:hypothetical protein
VWEEKEFEDFFTNIFDTIKTSRRISPKLRIKLHIINAYTKKSYDVEGRFGIGEDRKRF